MDTLIRCITSIGLLLVIFCYVLQMLKDEKNDKETREADKAIHEINLIKLENELSKRRK